MDASRSAKASSIGVGRGVIERSLAPWGLRGDAGGVVKTEEKEPFLCERRKSEFISRVSGRGYIQEVAWLTQKEQSPG